MIENDVINHLCIWLTDNGWTIESTALDRNHGDDIRASKSGQLLLVEAKGAKGNPKNHSVVRSEFDSGQIKDHLGKAIVKALELKTRNPTASIVIAHPATEKIRKIVSPVASHLIQLGISFAFVQDDGAVDWLGLSSGALKKVG
jgi:hypothetical protein